MDTPVVIIVFNRPDATRAVFEAVRAARPSRLLVVSDGSRTSRPGEAEKVAAARAVFDGVDWECEVSRDFSSENLGCKRRVASGIGWAFGLVDRAIILEDDCVPSSSFFRFCAEMLERYEDDERIMLVSGDNQLFGASFSDDSYYFSRNVHAWGWATWRRAWDKFDLEMRDWPEVRRRRLLDHCFSTPADRLYWDSLLQYVYEGNIDTWDYQWVYSILANEGLCVVPRKNLVRNIGFHAEATHTKSDSVYASLAAEELEFPLVHPSLVLQSSDADAYEARLRDRHRGGLPYPLSLLVAKAKRLVRRTVHRG